MSNRRYFVRLVADREIVFEEVSEAIYHRRDGALNDAGKKRYHSQRFIAEGCEFVECILDGLNVSVLGNLCRLFGVKEQLGATKFIHQPSHVKIQGPRGSESLIEVATGNEYKITKKAA